MVILMDILANAYGGITGIKAPSELEMMDKINEIIDYLNEQEKNNSRRANIEKLLKGE